MRLLTMFCALAATTMPALAQDVHGDVAAGEKTFKKCMACHAAGPDAKNKVGPELNGIVGRPAGSVADFAYSAGMKEAAAAGLVWTAEELDMFLTKPSDRIKGTKMSFPGLKKPEERQNVIAYLAQFPAEPAN